MVARRGGSRRVHGAASGTMRGVSLPTPIAERVLDLVARIPPGRVMAYGDVAAYLAEADADAEADVRVEVAGESGEPEESGPGSRAEPVRLGPRQVGRIMALYGGGVPWWRVLRADGTHAPGLEEGLRKLRAEGTPLRAGGTRVDMARARWDGGAGGAGPDPRSSAAG